MDYEFVDQFRNRARFRADGSADRRLWWAYARGCIVTAIAMMLLFVFALFGVG